MLFRSTVPMCAVIDESTVTGDQTYTLKFGFAADGISGKLQKNISASFTLSQIRMSVLELRK